MLTTSQLWFMTKKAAMVVGVLAIAHAVAAPRNCGGCAVKSSKSQVVAQPGDAGFGGPSGEGHLPYVEQKSRKKSSGKTKGSERGVIAIIKPGDKTSTGMFGSKGKSSPGETNAAGGGAWSPGTAQSYGTGVFNPGINLTTDTPRMGAPGAIGSGGGGVRAR
jgi:hypothetical protein